MKWLFGIVRLEMSEKEEKKKIEKKLHSKQSRRVKKGRKIIMISLVFQFSSSSLQKKEENNSVKTHRDNHVFFMKEM